MRPRKRSLPSVGAERAETADVAGGAAGVAASKPDKKPPAREPTKEGTS